MLLFTLILNINCIQILNLSSPDNTAIYTILCHHYAILCKLCNTQHIVIYPSWYSSDKMNSLLAHIFIKCTELIQLHNAIHIYRLKTNCKLSHSQCKSLFSFLSFANESLAYLHIAVEYLNKFYFWCCW